MQASTYNIIATVTIPTYTNILLYNVYNHQPFSPLLKWRLTENISSAFCILSFNISLKYVTRESTLDMYHAT